MRLLLPFWLVAIGLLWEVSIRYPRFRRIWVGKFWRNRFNSAEHRGIGYMWARLIGIGTALMGLGMILFQVFQGWGYSLASWVALGICMTTGLVCAAFGSRLSATPDDDETTSD